MTDIVKLLRDQAHMTQRDGLASMLKTAALAANEIERLRDKAENLVIAIGMGWDLDGVVEEMRKALENKP